MTLSGGYFHGYYNGTEYPFYIGNNYVANNTSSFKLALGYNSSTKKIEAYVDGKKQSFGDTLPIGTILAYVGSTANIPSGWALCNGSNGTPNLTGRFLEGVTSASAVKQLKAAGLPNITGNFFTDDEEYKGYFTGAFKWIKNISKNGMDDAGSAQSGIGQFNASWSDSIYGNSNTVQPASYTVMYIMKIKA